MRRNFCNGPAYNVYITYIYTYQQARNKGNLQQQKDYDSNIH